MAKENPFAPMKISPLADQPGAVSMLARWFYAEWHEIDGRSINSIEAQIRENLSRDSLPITFIAKVAANIVGTVSIDLSDLPPLDNLSPWIASLYVVPNCRGRGIATALLIHAQQFARRKEVGKLYLWTLGAPRFYENLGWRVLRHTTYNSRPVTVMQLHKNRFCQVNSLPTVRQKRLAHNAGNHAHQRRQGSSTRSA